MCGSNTCYHLLQLDLYIQVLPLCYLSVPSPLIAFLQAAPKTNHLCLFGQILWGVFWLLLTSSECLPDKNSFKRLCSPLDSLPGILPLVQAWWGTIVACHHLLSTTGLSVFTVEPVSLTRGPVDCLSSSTDCCLDILKLLFLPLCSHLPL